MESKGLFYTIFGVTITFSLIGISLIGFILFQPIMAENGVEIDISGYDDLQDDDEICIEAADDNVSLVCKNTQFCRKKDGKWVCEAKRKVDQSCQNNSWCLTNSCSPEPEGSPLKVCLGVVDVGGECEYEPKAQCKSGLICKATQLGDDYTSHLYLSQVKFCVAEQCSVTKPCLGGHYCKDSKCYLQKQAGQQCDEPKECVSVVCIQPEGGPAEASAAYGVDKICGCSENKDCVAVGGFCDEKGHCVTKKVIGDDCFSHEECGSDLYCDIHGCAEKKQSIDKDFPCVENEDCESGVCTELSPGVKFCGCSAQNHCNVVFECVNKLCILLKVTGVSCGSNDECQSKLCVKTPDAEGNIPAVGTCSATAAGGGVCAQNADCGTGLYCDPKEKKCTALKKEGACKKGYECLSGTCTSKKCKVPGPGDPCKAHADCSQGLACIKPLPDAGQPIDEIGICKEKLAAGMGCIDDAYCLSGDCLDHSKVCNASKVGSACENNTDCPEGEAYCENKKCVAKKDAGAKCKEDFECKVNQCVKAKPKDKEGVCKGQACIAGAENACPAGQYCKPNTDDPNEEAECAAKLKGGAECQDNSWCETDNCVGEEGSKKCAGKLEAGKPCKDGDECLSGKCEGGKCTAPAVKLPEAESSLASGAKIATSLFDKLKMFSGKGLIERDPETVVGFIIKTILGLIGTVALVMFVYGGVQWMIAGGNPDQIKKARDVFVWAALGLVVIFGAYVIVSFIIGLL